MKPKQIILAIIAICIGLFLYAIFTTSSTALSAEPQATSEPSQAVLDDIKTAVLGAIASNDSYIQKGLVPSLQVTDIQTSSDMQWATAWVVYYDPNLEARIPTEPSIPVIHQVDDQWQVYLPSDPGWKNAVSSTPVDLISQADKDMWLAMSQVQVETVTTQSGYYLPWHGGQTAYLSRSVGHDMSFPSGTSHFSFDFFLPGDNQCPSGSIQSSTTGLNFEIYAARAGTVWGWKDSVANCDHTDVNFIVIRNADDPTLFQLYMHLAQNSIPQALKSIGAPVSRGQFIALADNTGISTGSHLHFQVEHQPYWPSANPYWNTALDITFDDVSINGGRPRSSYYDPDYCLTTDVCDVFQNTYISNNYYLGDSTPPTGELSGVNNGATINTQTLTLTGWGTDAQSGLAYGQLIGLFEGSWHNLGSTFNPSLTYTWDFCNSQALVPNGPVSVALRLYDVAGNPAPQVGLRTFTKSYDCPVPPPSCIPDQNQVTLFEDAYLKGGCVIYSAGNFPTASSLGALGNNDTESIMVGSSVIATLYSEENYTGHSQAFLNNAGFIKYEWIGANSLSSMKITQRNTVPQAPVPVSPMASSVFRQGDIIPLGWLNGASASEYRAEIYLNGSLIRSLNWQSDPVAYIDSLALGSYTWRVQARNTAGSSAWSSWSSFSIESPIVVPSAVAVPYSDDMETSQSKWVASSSGMWSYKDNSATAHSGTHSWWYQDDLGDYDNDLPNSGTLTSPPINITGTGYYLRFYYLNQTETQGAKWDQRWVQISVDGGPFTNLIQIYDDPQIPEISSWLQNKAINLSAYNGHIIRIRFLFSTFDASANNYPGWGIDDFSITATAPTSCSENRQDETPEQAFLLTYDPTINVPGSICPNGDYDFYKFYGSAGDQIVADVDAMANGSSLDSYLFLIGPDGKTILAENDDEVFGVRRDPLLSYKLSENGTYYLKLKAWKHPLLGGDDYFYTIRLYEDHIKASAAISWPSSSAYLPDSTMTVRAEVNDLTNGVNRVEFYWHPTDWLSGSWVKFGTDWDGSDGWSMEFNPVGQAEGNTAIFYANVFDMAGNWSSAAAWNIGIDKTPPNTIMLPLPTSQASNAFSLGWTASDNLSGIAYFNIQESVNGGVWNTLPTIDGVLTKWWIIGNPGSAYSYKMRGIDYSGNTENYPTSAEVSTTIPSASILCSILDTFDTSGNDNTPANASTIYLDGPGQFHNFCNPLIPGFQNDEDWIKLTPTAGYPYLFMSVAKSSPSATLISLYAQDGSTLLAEAAPSAFGRNTSLGWIADRTEAVYLRLRHVDGRVIGKDVGGTFYVSTNHPTYVPVINR